MQYDSRRIITPPMHGNVQLDATSGQLTYFPDVTVSDAADILRIGAGDESIYLTFIIHPPDYPYGQRLRAIRSQGDQAARLLLPLQYIDNAAGAVDVVTNRVVGGFNNVASVNVDDYIGVPAFSPVAYFQWVDDSQTISQVMNSPTGTLFFRYQMLEAVPQTGETPHVLLKVLTEPYRDDNYLLVMLTPDALLEIRRVRPTTAYTVTAPMGAIGEWHSLALAWDANAMVVYHNGQEVTRVPFGLVQDTTPVYKLLLGSERGDGFTGSIAHFAAWSATLNANQIAAAHYVMPQERRFYVDSQYGSDNADGLSPATAWRSVERVNRHSFVPGDRVMFRRGQVWQQSEPLWIQASGTPHRPLVISAYGEGTMPHIENIDASADNYPHALRVTGNHVVVEHLSLRALEHGAFLAGYDNVLRYSQVTESGIGAAMRGDNSRLKANIIRDGRIFRNSPDPDDDYGATAVVLKGTDHVVTNLVIVNMIDESLDYDTDGAGVELFGSAQNILIENNFMHSVNAMTEVGAPDHNDVIRGITFRDNIVIASLHGIGAFHNSPALPFGVQMAEIVFENNIIYSQQDLIYIADENPSSAIRWADNLFITSSGAVFARGSLTDDVRVNNRYVGFTSDIMPPNERVLAPPDANLTWDYVAVHCLYKLYNLPELCVA